MKTIERALWTGIIATSAMTLSLLALRKLSLKTERRPLPPARLTGELLDAAPSVGPEEPKIMATMLSHYAFGIGSALVYSLLQNPKKTPRIPLALGAAYGMTVWSASYMVGIPALGFKSSAYKMSVQTNGMMILAHLVFGASVGFSDAELKTAGAILLSARDPVESPHV